MTIIPHLIPATLTSLPVLGDICGTMHGIYGPQLRRLQLPIMGQRCGFGN